MVKRIVFIMFSCLLLPKASLFACDACGCSASNMGIGLMTDYRSNFVRVGFFNTRFKSHPEHEYLVSDNFTQMDLSIRYAIGKNKRVRLNANVPFRMNSRSSEGEHLIEKGLSDIRFTANYVVLDNLPIGKKSTLYLETGGGFNFPTGRYDENIHDRDLPDNFNIGQGNFGYVFQMNAVFGFAKYGIVFSNNYQLNSKTKSGYHFGNQFNTQIIGFKEFKLKKFKLIPNAGILFESISNDNYANGKSVSETGGGGMFLSTAMNFKTDKWLAGISYTNPIMQQYSNNAVIAKERAAIHFSIIF